jgi:hypothetical protein
MNQPRRNRPRPRRPAPAKRATEADLWRTPPPLPPIEPITVPAEVDTLLRSLGDAPAIGGNAVLGHYVTAVVERAAAVAAALALSAELLADPDAPSD